MFRRRWRLGIVVLTACALLLCARWLQSSRLAADHVARELERMFGAPVKIAEAHVGAFGASRFGKLQAAEPSGSRDATPWFEAAEIETDHCLAGVLRGVPPSAVSLKGWSIDLRFDAEGNLLTRLPLSPGPRTALPLVSLAEGRLVLTQEGRRPLVVTGISGSLADRDDILELTGAIDDPYWGQWRVTGNLALDGSRGQLHLVTDSVPVDQAKLEALPFVSPKVWRQVQAEGMTPVDFTLEVRRQPGGGPAVHYRLVLEPTETRVCVASIGLNADRARGKVAVEDGRVTLRDVTGQTAGGQIDTTADMDFRDEISTMRFLVAVRDMVLRQLPKNWSVPLLDGRLSGQADLQLTVRSGRLQTAGRGEGTITNAQLGPRFLRLKPIRLLLKADGERFRLDAAGSALRTIVPVLLR